MKPPTNPERLWAYVTCVPYRRIEVGTVPDALEQDVRDGVDATVSEYIRADVAAREEGAAAELERIRDRLRDLLRTCRDFEVEGARAALKAIEVPT